MGWLENTSVLVTGGGSGMGRAIVERFVEEGARVAVFDRSADKLADVAEQFGDAVRTVQGDVTSTADNAAAVDTAVGAFGGLDVFIGNAGVWDFSRSLLDSSPEDLAKGFDELFAVNVKGYLLGARASAEALRTSRGSMVFTLSNASFFPGGGGPLYTASKHAGTGLVKQLAFELSPEIRVNGVAPGGMATDLRGPDSLGLSDTKITDALPLRELMIKHSALQREITAQDYVGTYVLLASRRNSASVTGTVFDISSFGTPRRPGP
ncbi:3-(cis-5,6-dihydroxycyclohexa-1,3-dien-1-yl)propanoate dehydrogenase [Streptomyces sp. NPDC001068]|uniref:3-(cis-5,6-dihydroxycyclohexa-1, 3-dien-1-yl)propanoate dehydrogenase n=1 Tax=Streptomyces sp. NPDC001068 TaxID=3364544 RepID=UPI0036910C34